MNVTEDQHTQLALGIARLEEQLKALATLVTSQMEALGQRIDVLERRMDAFEHRMDRLTAEQRWTTVVLAALIGALGVWS